MYYFERIEKNNTGVRCMNRFTKGIIAGSVIAAALGITGMTNSRWMKRRVFRPSKSAARKVARMMNEIANMID